MTGVAAVMARIGQIQSMAQRAGGAFGVTLDRAVAMAPTEVPARIASSDSRSRLGSVDLTDLPPAGLPAGASRWHASVERAARANGIDPKLFTALVWVESGFDANAVSHAGAIGLAQLMPDTARGLAVDPYDPEQNLDGGARFLASMIDRFGRTDLALAAYNAGPARVASLHDGGPDVPIAEGYVNAVYEKYRQLGGAE